MNPHPPSSPNSKSEQTRARVLAAALKVFRERGFQAATMREIAAEAKMAVGAAYYYFDSKDALVMAFYEQAQEEMTPAFDEVLARSRTLEQRIRGIIGVKLESFAPNRALLAGLSAHSDPHHPLSPFSAPTATIRNRDIAYFERAIADSGLRLPASILRYIPRLLWLYQMGLIWFWVYDDSSAQSRTQMLFDKSLDIILVLVRLGSFPLMRPLHRRVADLLKSVLGEEG
jgi:AcrR family transcriptional regulator